MTAWVQAKLHATSGATGELGRWTILQPYLRAIVWRDRDANADDDLCIDACRWSGMATRPELAGSATAKLSANWSLPGPLSVRRR
jgi:hypothetical protein